MIYISNISSLPALSILRFIDSIVSFLSILILSLILFLNLSNCTSGSGLCEPSLSSYNPSSHIFPSLLAFSLSLIAFFFFIYSNSRRSSSILDFSLYFRNRSFSFSGSIGSTGFPSLSVTV